MRQSGELNNIESTEEFEEQVFEIPEIFQDKSSNESSPQLDSSFVGNYQKKFNHFCKLLENSMNSLLDRLERTLSIDRDKIIVVICFIFGFFILRKLTSWFFLLILQQWASKKKL